MQVKAADALCQVSKNNCDFPECRTGLSAVCLEDVFQVNASPARMAMATATMGPAPRMTSSAMCSETQVATPPPSSPHRLSDTLGALAPQGRALLSCGPLLHP